MQQSIKKRLEALEALEAARQPETPAVVCLHPLDFAALDDEATPEASRAAIVEAYQIAGVQKWYIGLCMCWGAESCRVCDDRPVVEGQ